MRSLTLTVRFHTKGGHERQAHVPTQHASPKADAWISRTDVHQKWPSRLETPSRKRPEATDRLERLAQALTGPWPDFVPPNGFAGEQSSSRCMSGERGYIAATALCSFCPANVPWRGWESRRHESLAAPFSATGLSDSFERFFAVTRSLRVSTSLSCPSVNCLTPA